jgi:hypothetical protein
VPAQHLLPSVVALGLFRRSSSVVGPARDCRCQTQLLGNLFLCCQLRLGSDASLYHSQSLELHMNSLIYLVGLIVVVLLILSFFGLR